ncbi:cation:proton antiporter [Stenotrophobium rhamnosiphilum]|uniref:Cation:proton antiporter n=2 Tax=Stenotrophobium rhamnosiphilum TaxID=2029166 RepID=A0A2T5MGR9_9GAMM|nr:cation:proton antiporter [Stenotrophobium rhamnosiphilum]
MAADTAVSAAEHAQHLLLGLFLIFAAAKVMAEVFERLRQPAVIGEILAGVLIGPYVLGWVEPSEITHTLSEIGVILLLFSVGLETKPASIIKVGKTATIVAVLGVVLPFAAGWGLMELYGATNIEGMFVGTAMVATSVGITARVLGGMGMLGATSSRIILGAAVIDDILGLLVLAVVASMAAGSTDFVKIGTTAGLSLGFVAVVALLLAPMLTRHVPRLGAGVRISHAAFAASIVLCLGLAAAASYIGVAAIIGAFLAGMAIAEVSEDNHELHSQIRGVTEFMVPFFLVGIGMQLNLTIFNDMNVVWMAVWVTLIAVVTKVVGCGLGAWSLGLRGAAQVGVGMVPRGEVGIVVAQIGLGMGVISESLFGVVLFMAIATTLIAPPFLRPLFARTGAAD